MNDLISWLRQQLDTDEQAARAVGPRPWYFDMIEDEAAPFVDLALNADRVLRQIQAHRAILDLYDLAQDPIPVNIMLLRGRFQGYRQALDDVVRNLVSIYSDRDGYKEEWNV